MSDTKSEAKSTGGARLVRKQRYEPAFREVIKVVSPMTETKSGDAPAAASAAGEAVSAEEQRRRVLLAKAFTPEKHESIYIYRVMQRNELTKHRDKLMASRDRIVGGQRQNDLSRQDVAELEASISKLTREIEEFDISNQEPPATPGKPWMNQRAFGPDFMTDEQIKTWNSMPVTVADPDTKVERETEVSEWFTTLQDGTSWHSRFPGSVPVFATAVTNVKSVVVTFDSPADVRLGHLICKEVDPSQQFLHPVVVTGLDKRQLAALDPSIDVSRSDFHIMPLGMHVEHAATKTDGNPVEVHMVTHAFAQDAITESTRLDPSNSQRFIKSAEPVRLNVLRKWSAPKKTSVVSMKPGTCSPSDGVILREDVPVPEMHEDGPMLYEVDEAVFSDPWVSRAMNLDTRKLRAELNAFASKEDNRLRLKEDPDLLVFDGPKEACPAELDSVMLALVLGLFSYLGPMTDAYIKSDKSKRLHGEITSPILVVGEEGRVIGRKILVSRLAFSQVLDEIERRVSRSSVLANLHRFGLAVRIPCNHTGDVEHKRAVISQERDQFVADPFVRWSVRVKMHYIPFLPGNTFERPLPDATMYKAGSIVGHWPPLKRPAYPLRKMPAPPAAKAKAVAPVESKAALGSAVYARDDSWDTLSELVDSLAEWDDPKMIDDELAAHAQLLAALHKKLATASTSETLGTSAKNATRKRIVKENAKIELLKKVKADIPKVFKAGMNMQALSHALLGLYAM